MRPCSLFLLFSACTAEIPPAPPVAPDLAARGLTRAAPSPWACEDLGPSHNQETKPLYTQVFGPDRAPRAGIAVGWRQHEGDAWAGVVQTDANGEVTLQVPVGAEVGLVDPALENRWSSGCPFRRLPDGRDGYTQVMRVLIAPDLCSLEVQVTDAQGAPVAGAAVDLAPVKTSVGADAARTLGVTGADGRLRERAACGEVRLQVRPTAQAWEVLGPITLTDGLSVPVGLAAEGATLSGVLTDDLGAPLAGAVVMVADSGLSFPSRVDALEMPTAITGADGRYTLMVSASKDDLGWRELVARTRGGDTAESKVLARAGQSLTWDPAITTTRAVEVRCAGEHEDACWYRLPQCVAPGEAYAAAKGKDGTWQALAIEGEVHHARARCPKGAAVVYVDADLSVQVGPDDAIAWVDLRGLGGGITAQVTPRTPPIPAILRRGLGRTNWVLLPDAEGHIRFDRLPPGDYTLEAFSESKPVSRDDIHVEADVVDLGVLTP